MVNQIFDKKKDILKCLYRAGGETVSGVMISQETGISRVAVWKHIKALKENGFNIDTRARGYALGDPQDLLLPFCFEQDLENKIFHFQEVESTMDTAKDIARQGAPHLSCVVAEHQTKSRGRLGRQWISSKGGLWFTLILKPDLPPPLAYIFNFAASLSLSLTLKQLFDLDVSVKWPNDILLNGKKLVGMLSEMETRADMVSFLVLGIGINVNNAPDSEDFAAVSLKDVLNRPVSRKEILIKFLSEFQRHTMDIDPGRIIERWKTQTSTIGSRVKIKTIKDITCGIALDVDETGALIIEDDSKQIRKIIYGDCFHT